MSSSRGKRLLFVVNVDWFFVSHRLPLALAAMAEGYEVHLATTVTTKRMALEQAGIVLHPMSIDRNSANPLKLFLLFVGFLRLFRKIRPDVVHLVTIKPVLVGGAAARFSPVGGVVCAVSGLGHVFAAQGVLAKIRKLLVKAWYGFVFRLPRLRVIFQNSSDLEAVQGAGLLKPEQVVMIPGSGVDLQEFQPGDGSPDRPVILMAARLLISKGVREFAAAASKLSIKPPFPHFWLAGEIDSGNPAAVPQAELASWQAQGSLEVLGQRKDIADLMTKASVVVLPSYYGEGLPRVLIEAAAAGLPVITTDHPGCRDAIEDGVTGLLVPPRDAEALAEAIHTLLASPALRAEMGHAARERAERLFDIRSVVATHLEIYRELSETT